MAESALQKTDNNVAEFLKKFGKGLKDYAIRDYNHDAFMKSAMIAIVDNPELAKAVTTEPGKLSLFNSLRYAATTGLSLNPQEGKACLIPYAGKIQYQVMKNGMVDLALESGKVEFIMSDVIHENDTWQFPQNPNDNYIYQPARRNRGGIDGFFAAMKLKTGALLVKYIDIDQMRDHRKKYSSKSQMPEVGYGLKTVIKALLRTTSLSADIDNAIATDDFYEAEFTVHGTTADKATEKIKQPDKKVEAEVQGDLL